MKTHLKHIEDSDALIINALRCLEIRLHHHSAILNNSRNVRAYLRLQLAEEESEMFSVLFLNTQHRLLAFEKLFRGSINEAVVYPRTIVQKALEHNAAKVILAHNHPSNNCSPSTADKEITESIRKILNVIDVQVVDHVIVSRQGSFSFSEHSLL